MLFRVRRAATLAAAVCWIIPAALSQTAPDVYKIGGGVSAPVVIHKVEPEYSEEARNAKYQGTAVLSIVVNTEGAVDDIKVVRSLGLGLDEKAIEAVRQWRFRPGEKDGQPVKVMAQIEVNFRLLEGPRDITQSIADFTERIRLAPDNPNLYFQRGLLYASQARNDLALADASEAIRLKPTDGAFYLFRAHLRRLSNDVQGADADMRMAQTLMPPSNTRGGIGSEVQRSGVIGGIVGSAPPGASSGMAATQTPQRIRVGGNVQSANLIRKVEPIYPPLAKQARVQGTVRFQAIVGKDGTIQNLQLVSGHPLLVAPAQEAVKQWVYKPTLLNGEPVEVVTQIDVNFTLSLDSGGGVVGRWRSAETSQGGIGAMFEFHPGVSVDYSPGAVVEQAYRIEGGQLVLPPATVNGPEQKFAVGWPSSGRLNLMAGAIPSQLIRVSAPRNGEDPILGEWTSTSEMAGKTVTTRWLFYPNGKLLLLVPFTTQSGCYVAVEQMLRLELPGQEPVTGPFSVDGDRLTMPSPNGKGVSLFIRY